MKALLACALVSFYWPAIAHADDTFETRAQGATRITRHEDIVWAMTATCDKGDDALQRQCRIVRDRKIKQLTSGPLLVDGDGDAFEIGAWNAAKKSVPMTLVACVRCSGVDVDGHTYFMTGAGAKLDGQRLRAATLYDNARQLADESAANTWKQSIANTRVEMVVKVVGKQRATVGGPNGKDILPVDIVAWRVLNACSGTVVISSQPSGPGQPDKKACAPATGGGGGDGGSGGTISPDVTPDALTPAMVQDAMRPVVAAARECATRMKINGKAKLELVINADGTVGSHQQTGDFAAGTPINKCIEQAVQKLRFPATKKPTTKIGYPIVL